jgi:oligopeptide/dipeptide ABC transporter ATP-binding protein
MQAAGWSQRYRTHFFSVTGCIPTRFHFSRLPTGCIFADRCPVMQPECQKSPPALRELSDGRRVACHFVEEKEGTVQNTLTGGLEMINVLV